MDNKYEEGDTVRFYNEDFSSSRNGVFSGNIVAVFELHTGEYFYNVVVEHYGGFCVKEENILTDGIFGV